MSHPDVSLVNTLLSITRVSLVQNKCVHYILIFYKHIYTTIGGPSSKFDEFLAALSQFDSDHGVDFSTPTSCQSVTLVRQLFAFYCTFFLRKKIMQHFVTGAAMFTLRD